MSACRAKLFRDPRKAHGLAPDSLEQASRQDDLPALDLG